MSLNRIILNLAKFSFSFLTAFLVFFLLPIQAEAASTFITEVCNLSNIVGGSAGKTVAAFAVVGVGVGFFTGRVSWNILVGTCAGIGLIYGAPTVVSAISGKSYFQCVADQTYITTCSGGECYSCPMGYGGSNCTSCGTGFTGPSCDQCATGYTGTSCSECTTGYTRYDGACHPNCSISVTGVTTTSVSGGLGTTSCNAANFTGTISYSCLNGSFTQTSYNCSCTGNYTGASCNTCIAGYTTASLCTDCSSGYTKVNSICYPDCTSSTVTGVELSSSYSAIALSGSISCNGLGYGGSVNYSCVNGVFSATSGSSCTPTPNCVGGTISIVTISGTSYKIHTFTSSGTLTCSAAKNVQVLVVGGGGGGGSTSGTGGGGGGGAGGVVYNSSFAVSTTPITVTVGAGGSGAEICGLNNHPCPNGSNGGNSIFSTITAYGGGGGGCGGHVSTAGQTGNSGASGGGSGLAPGLNLTGAASSYPTQGNNGGSSGYKSGGGGGAGAAGSSGYGSSVGNGGIGVAYDISGTSTYYGGGGGGGSYFSSKEEEQGVGGLGGGGSPGVNATANTGGGGGGSRYYNTKGFAGGSGIVIVRYPNSL